MWIKSQFKEIEMTTPLFVTEGNYLTAAGYVINLDDNLDATKEYSPGINSNGKTSDKHENGWRWKSDGFISGLQPEWEEKLRIVQKLDLEIPDQPPAGYQWKGGFPQIREVQQGEEYLQFCSEKTFRKIPYKYGDMGDRPSGYHTQIGYKRLIVEPVEVIPNDLTSPISFGDNRSTVKEKKMPQFISVSKFIGSLILRAARYWVAEPATTMIMKVVSSVRYVTFVTMLVGGTYTYFNPEPAKALLENLTPKVSISFEKPAILKGSDD